MVQMSNATRRTTRACCSIERPVFVAQRRMRLLSSSSKLRTVMIATLMPFVQNPIYATIAMPSSTARRAGGSAGRLVGYEVCVAPVALAIPGLHPEPDTGRSSPAS